MALVLALVTHSFNKKPTAKNLKNRSISFQSSEYSVVSANDLVEIEVDAKTHTIKIVLSGEDFKSKCSKRSKYGNNFYVLKF